MRLASYSFASVRSIGVVLDGRIIDIPANVPGAPADMVELMSAWDAWRDAVANLGQNLILRQRQRSAR